MIKDKYFIFQFLEFKKRINFIILINNKTDS